MYKKLEINKLMLKDNQKFEKVSQLLKFAKSVIITSHHNPDGDAVGSAMALFHALSKSVPDVKVLLPNPFPDFLAWINGSEKIIIFEKENQQTIQKMFDIADMVICVDYNTPSRTGKMETALREAAGVKVLIDHHPEPDLDFFDYSFSETSASSTAELVYIFLEQIELAGQIDLAAAESLYAGIITDTGSFSFACNSPHTYQIVAKLIETGVNAERLHRLIYDNFSEQRLRLLGYAFNDKLTVINDFRTAIICLSDDELARFSSKPGDTEGIVNYPLSIKEVIISILITQRGDHLRLSLRSKGNFAVNRIAKDHFDGGGHRNAAGGNSYSSMDETIQKIRAILPFYVEDIFNTIV